MSMDRGTTLKAFWRNVDLLELTGCETNEAIVIAYNWLEESCNRKGMLPPLDALEAAADASIELQERGENE